jgi:glycosyltransferase involved in cell wall biosynthesis
MKILFIGGIYPKIFEPLFLKKTKRSLDFGAQNLQEAMFKGLDKNDIEYQILNAPLLGSFPLFNKMLFIPGYCSRDAKIKSIPYINLPYIKRWDINKKIKRDVYRWFNRTAGEKIIVLYSFNYVGIIRPTKVDFPATKILLLITDLPEFMSDNQNKVYRFLKNIDEKIIFKSLRYIDGFILLTQHMAGCLPIGDKPFMVMEGIYNTNDNIGEVPKEPYKTILYTGSLERRYGILDLVKAFVRIDRPDYRLWLCGNGDALNEIKKAQKNDTRIRYFGILPRNEALKLQRMATVLVNPRHSSEEYTKYSFPSKTMEYLASGTPTLMCRLPCLPKEYEPYIYFFDDESVEGMRNKIIEICEKSREELGEFGKKAAKFIRDEKNPYMQCKKILSFIRSL